jgi:hypothetical protein
MQIIFCWVFTAIVIFWTYRGYTGLIRLRRKYFQSVEYQGSMHSRTLLVSDVPRQNRSDQGLGQLASTFKPTSVHYSQAHIGRDMGDLPDLIEKHSNAVKKLEKYLAVYLKNPDKLPDKRPTCKPKGKSQRIDAIDYYTVLSVSIVLIKGPSTSFGRSNRCGPGSSRDMQNNSVRIRIISDHSIGTYCCPRLTKIPSTRKFNIPRPTTRRDPMEEPQHP